MTNKNYSLMLEQTISDIVKSGQNTSLLLHVCCAPCSSYVLEYLAEFFDITLFFYNPNISPQSEYNFRERELERMLFEMPLPSSVKIISGRYTPQEFYEMAKGLEHLPEGDLRCKKCYRMRLAETADVAHNLGFDYFTTTLSISPYKNAEWLNSIGAEEGDRVGVKYLFSDFKKKNGYKRSCELSAQYGLYRQDYCGCEFSRRDAKKRKESN